MICQPCRQAGTLLSLGEYEVAAEFHSRCPAVRRGQPTHCDCQHATDGSYLNREVWSEVSAETPASSAT